MRSKRMVSVLFLAAAALALNAAPAWSQSKPDKSVGGSQSERTGPGTEPTLPKGDPAAGSTDPSKAGKGPGSGSAQSGKDTSVGGTQSERTGPGTEPTLPKGSRSAGSGEPSRAGQGASSAAMGGQKDVREAQEALKVQGHDPGPIDGVMGSQTRQALKAFQSKNGLKQTGNLDAETKQKLNIEGASGSSAGSGARSGKGESPAKQKESSSPMGK